MNRAPLLLLLPLLASAASAAQPGYLKPYDAVYELTTSAGKSTMHQMSDGKGHLRTETSQGGTKTTSIMDFPGKMVYTLMESQKLYLKQPMSSSQQESADLSKPAANARSLGGKVVDAHPCHGYESRTEGGVSKLWIGDDIQNLVHSESTTSTAKTVMALKSYSPKAPSQDLLAIPQGFKEMKLPKIAGAR